MRDQSKGKGGEHKVSAYGDLGESGKEDQFSLFS